MNVSEYLLKYSPHATSVSTKDTKKYVIGFVGDIRGNDANTLQVILDELNINFPRTFPNTTKFAFVISSDSITNKVVARIGTNNFRAYLIYTGSDNNDLSESCNEILPGPDFRELCDCIVVFNDSNVIKHLNQQYPEIKVIEVNT